MRIPRKTVLILCLFYLLVSVVPVFAQTDPLPEPCEGAIVSGKVVAVHEAAMVATLLLEDGSHCTVVLAQDTYNHPVIALLGKYFEDVSAEALSESLQTLQGCALFDQTSSSWHWVSCETQDALPIKITAFDQATGFSAVLNGSEEEVLILIDDPLAAENLLKSLASLTVSWTLDGTGAIIEAGEEIAAYHDAGMGFGVLVKLYAMAEEAQEACMDIGAAEDSLCGITVDELVNQFNEGMGMGELFEVYGKPAMRGVGHVLQELREDQGKPPWAGPKDGTAEEDPLEVPETESESQHGPPDHANGNPAHGKPNGKDKNKPGRPDHAGPPVDKGKK